MGEHLITYGAIEIKSNAPKNIQEAFIYEFFVFQYKESYHPMWAEELTDETNRSLFKSKKDFLAAVKNHNNRIFFESHPPCNFTEELSNALIEYFTQKTSKEEFDLYEWTFEVENQEYGDSFIIKQISTTSWNPINQIQTPVQNIQIYNVDYTPLNAIKYLGYEPFENDWDDDVILAYFDKFIRMLQNELNDRYYNHSIKPTIRHILENQEDFKSWLKKNPNNDEFWNIPEWLSEHNIKENTLFKV